MPDSQDWSRPHLTAHSRVALFMVYCMLSSHTCTLLQYIITVNLLHVCIVHVWYAYKKTVEVHYICKVSEFSEIPKFPKFPDSRKYPSKCSIQLWLADRGTEKKFKCSQKSKIENRNNLLTKSLFSARPHWPLWVESVPCAFQNLRTAMFCW